MEPVVRVEGERRPQSRWLALVAITAIALYLCWQMLEPFVNVLVWAGVLAIVFYPVHRRIEDVTRRPGLSALVSLVLVMATVIFPLVAVGTALVRELSGFATTAQGSVQEMIANPPQDERVQGVLAFVERYVNVREVFSPERIREAAGSVSQVLLQGTVGVVGGALGFIVKTVFVLFTLFYLFRDAPAIVEQVTGFLPLDHARANALMARTHEVISASVTGVLVISAIQGTLGGVMFWALGVPSPLLWGVLMTLLSMIPMVGSGVVWVPAAILLAVTGHWVKALILTGWGTLVIGMVDNFLRPRLVGGKTQLHPLLVFFSVLGGLQVFGMTGLLMGPVVLAITLALLAVFREAPDEPQVAPLAVAE